MFVRFFLFDVIFNHGTSRAKRITDIQDLDDDVGAVDDLVQLVPDSFALSGPENVFPHHLFLVGHVAHQVLVLLLGVARFGVLDRLKKERKWLKLKFLCLCLKRMILKFSVCKSLMILLKIKYNKTSMFNF